MTKKEYQFAKLNRLNEAMYAVNYALERGKSFFENGNKTAGRDCKRSLIHWLELLEITTQEVKVETQRAGNEKDKHWWYTCEEADLVVAGDGTANPLTVEDLANTEDDCGLVYMDQRMLDVYTKIAGLYERPGEIHVTAGFILRKRGRCKGYTKHNKGLAIDFYVDGECPADTVGKVFKLAKAENLGIDIILHNGYVHVHLATGTIQVVEQMRAVYSKSCQENHLHAYQLVQRYPDMNQ